MDLSEAIKIKDPGKLIRHPWELARLKIVQYLLKIQSRLPYHHLLDVGTGDGFILKQLMETNAAINFSAVDPAFSEDNLATINSWQRPGKLGLYRQLDEMGPGPEKADCILLLDVLEHVADDKALIQAISNHPGVSHQARWIITVPAFQFLYSRHDRQLQHYRRYNLKQLRNLCTASGLQIDKSGYFFFTLIPLRFIQKLMLLFSGNRPVSTIEDWKGGAYLKKIVEKALWMDFRIGLWFSKFRIPVPGLSCYCICRQPQS